MDPVMSVLINSLLTSLRYGLNHEKFDDICVRIPLLFLGPEVKRGHTITGYRSITDVAPTALNALGLQPGKYMVGKVLEDIYD